MVRRALPSRERPLSLRRRGGGSVALLFVLGGPLADRRRAGDEVRRRPIALLSTARRRIGRCGPGRRRHVLVGTIATRELVVVRIDVVLAAHVRSPSLKSVILGRSSVQSEAQERADAARLRQQRRVLD